MRKLRTHIKHITVRKWFPPEDPLASIFARLCVLREDLFIELQGMHNAPIDLLDECSVEVRKIYFFRNSMRTLLEIRSAIETLRMNRNFKATIEKHHAHKQAFSNLVDAMTQAHQVIKRLRHEIGGHLKDKAFKEALEKIDPTTKSLIQVGNKPKEIHYKFILEFIGATILRHTPQKDLAKEWAQTQSKTFEASFRAIKALDMVFEAYAFERRLQD